MYYSTWQSVIVTVTNVTVVAQSHQVVVADEIYVAFAVVGWVGTSGPVIVAQVVELVRLQWSVWGIAIQHDKNEVLHFPAFTVVGSHKVAVHNTCTLASCYRFIRVIRG